MNPILSLRLLRAAAILEKVGDSRMSLDMFVQDVNRAHEDMSQTVKNAEQVKDLLERSGYPELAGKMGDVLHGIREVSDIIDTFRSMYSKGKLRFGPRA